MTTRDIEELGLCEYKNLFGKPREGLHAYRLFDVAIVDVLATLFLSVLLSRYVVNYSWYTVFIFLVLISIPIHRLFCVKTVLS